MKKSEAAKIFGNQSRLAEALGVSPAAVSQWDQDLTVRQTDEIIGAAIRLGLIKSYIERDRMTAALPVTEEAVAAIGE